MSYCEIHERNPHTDRNTFQNCCKSSKPSWKKVNRQILKQFSDQHYLCNNTKPHYSGAIKNDCEKIHKNGCKNLKDKPISLKLHKPLNTKSSEMRKKNKKCSDTIHQLGNKNSACACSTDQNHCDNSGEKLKPAIPETTQHVSNIPEEIAQPNSFVPNKDCKHSHYRNNREKGTKSKISIPHTDCKYCINNINSKEKIKNPLHHTDCKYCLNNFHNNTKLRGSDTSSTSSESFCLEELSDELLSLDSKNGDGYYIPCLLHDRELNPLYFHNTYCKMHQRRPIPRTCHVCEYPELCLVNNPHPSSIRDYLIDPYFQSIQDLNIKSGTHFKPCEFCLRNGENPVIYNSHQFRNTFGTVTCPILKKNIYHKCELETCENYFCNCDETTSAINRIHPNIPISHMGLGATTLSDLYSTQSSLDISPPYTFKPKLNPQENRDFLTNFNACVCCTEKDHNSSHYKFNSHLNLPTPNQYDTAIPFSISNQNYASKLTQSNNSAFIRKPKKDVSCQFCLTTGKPPYIYNSHELRDESGANIKCPILKEHVTGTISHNCNNYLHNMFECEICFPLVKGITNGSLGTTKRQYFDSRDLLLG